MCPRIICMVERCDRDYLIFGRYYNHLQTNHFPVADPDTCLHCHQQKLRALYVMTDYADCPNCNCIWCLIDECKYECAQGKDQQMNVHQQNAHT